MSNVYRIIKQNTSKSTFNRINYKLKVTLVKQCLRSVWCHRVYDTVGDRDW